MTPADDDAFAYAVYCARIAPFLPPLSFDDWLLERGLAAHGLTLDELIAWAEAETDEVGE